MTTRNGGKNKQKKPLETTLGKAPVQCSKDEPFDLSHIQKPLDTSVFGLRQVLSLVHTATDEVKNYVTYECDILYECRICRSIFRSLANFILHKRRYCQEKYSSSKNWKINETCDVLKICEDDEDNNTKNEKEKCPKSLSNVLDNLLNKQQNAILTQNVLNGENFDNGPELFENPDKCSGVLVLEKIKGCDNALFQTKKNSSSMDMSGHLNTDLMKSEVMEIHSILDNDEAILGPDGKILSSSKKSSDYLPKKDLMCTICDQRFSTKKTLSCHIKYKHNKNRLVYPCPECNDTLSNTWCVFRHLIKVHRKTPTEIKKLRDVIHSNAIIKEQQETSSVSGTNGNKEEDKFKKREETESQHNQQWMNDFESANDLQMCGGCGRRFERKAALHAHSQICHKRIALCNSIKENNNKQAVEEVEKNAKEKLKSNSNNNNTISNGQSEKGSGRRKPLVLRRNCKSNIKERNDHNCGEHKGKVCDDGVITISNDEIEEEPQENVVKKEALPEDDLVKKKASEHSKAFVNVKKNSPENSKTSMKAKKNSAEDSKALGVVKKEPAEDSKSLVMAVKKEPKISELPVDIMKEINSKIAEVIDNIKRKRLSAEEFAEDCDSGPEMAPSNNEPTPSEDEDCIVIDIDNDEQQKRIGKNVEDRKKVFEVIFGPSSTTVTKKRKLEDQKDFNSNNSSSKEDVSSSSDSDVSSPPFEAFNKLESDDSVDSVKSPSSSSEGNNNDNKIKFEGDENEKQNKVVENNFVSKRPVRCRTSTLRKDFLYDIVQNKPKSNRLNNREISVNNNNNNGKKNKTHK